MLVLNHAEVMALLEPGALIATLEEGFRLLSKGQVEAPARSQVRSPAGALLVMPAGLPGEALSVKLVSVFHDNTDRPSHQALVVLFDAQNGSPLALLDGAAITTSRTAACSMIAVGLLARADAKVAVVIGAGAQGQAHARMLAGLGRFEQILISDVEAGRAAALGGLDGRIQAAGSLEEAVREADVICLCSSATRPVLEESWLKGGVHIGSVGYNPPGSELGGALAASGRLFVESRRAFEAAPVGCVELAGMDPQLGTELGEVLMGVRPGRREAEERTIYKSMGHAMEDAVAANLVYRLACERGMGTPL